MDLDTPAVPGVGAVPAREVYFKNSMVLFSEEGMLARRRLDINASYGCSLICRFCFHLGIAGDMQYDARTSDGERDVEVHATTATSATTARATSWTW